MIHGFMWQVSQSSFLKFDSWSNQFFRPNPTEVFPPFVHHSIFPFGKCHLRASALHVFLVWRAVVPRPSQSSPSSRGSLVYSAGHAVETHRPVRPVRRTISRHWPCFGSIRPQSSSRHFPLSEWEMVFDDGASPAASTISPRTWSMAHPGYRRATRWLIDSSEYNFSKSWSLVCFSINFFHLTSPYPKPDIATTTGRDWAQPHGVKRWCGFSGAAQIDNFNQHVMFSQFCTDAQRFKVNKETWIGVLAF